jgi:hypothetical protein
MADPITLAAAAKAVGTFAKDAAPTGGDAKNIGMYYLQRHHAKKDYERMRKDALSDFHMANAYNSPAEQMNRLREAGLNPNLVYGKGADMAAVQMRGSQKQTANTPGLATTLDRARALHMGQGLALEKAQTDNVIADTKNKALTGASIALTNVQKAIENEKDAVQRDILIATQNDLIEQVRLNTEIKQNIAEFGDLQIQYAVTEEQRKALLSENTAKQAAQSILESNARIAKMEFDKETDKTRRQLIQKQMDAIDQAIKNAQQDERIKTAIANWREAGVMEGDSIYVRAGVQLLVNIMEGLGVDVSDIKGMMAPPKAASK